MANMNYKDLAIETEEIVDMSEPLITAHFIYSSDHFADQIHCWGRPFQRRRLCSHPFKETMVKKHRSLPSVSYCVGEGFSFLFLFFGPFVLILLEFNQDNVANKKELEMVEKAKPEHHESTVKLHTKDEVEDDVAIDIKAILEDKNESLLSTKYCIYRVPHGIRKQNPEAYTPQVVSIGPLHYGNPNLQNMETHKQVFFKAFLERSHTSLDNSITIVKNSEQNVRECYSENINLSKKELVKIILVDAGFIIELFWKIHEAEDSWHSLDDFALSTPWFTNKIMLDLILLENQLPFFILEETFNLAFPPHTCVDLPSFLKLTCVFFDYYNVQKLDPNTTPDFSTKHFTDLLRTFHLNPQKSERCFFDRMGSNALLYGANELHEAGVKFKPNTTSKCLLDLSFSKGVLEIPQIMVQEETEHEFRNMIALEQCHYPFESYICDYALFLDCLINTSSDVDILARREIIRKFLADSDDVAQVFNGLCKDILHVNFNADYYNMCTKLNAFYKNPWNNMKATLRRDYCKTPWQIVASIAGILLLILTLVQTIFSITK